ncbi:MAG: septum formation inhibitor Maf [Alphaproteobacteria bacterium]|nr:MAG: septum formation inhibitor Maf [Alphaproteobacteria bacterium]
MTDKPRIILASGSQGRQAMLRNAGLPFHTIPANIDEDAIIARLTAGNRDIKFITAQLATDKALHISAANADTLVIGSDQTLESEGALLSKAVNTADAEAKLKSLRGKTHILHSAVSLVRDGEVIFSYTDHASLTMHDFDDDFLENYMKKAPDALTSCVGGYKIEGAGAWLFSSVTGDLFTIMGMPLLPLLSYLRTECEFSL